MVRFGIAGIGFMGMIHHLALGAIPRAKVTAIWSRDPKKRAGDWSGIQGNFGPPGGPVDLTGINAHAEYADLIADPDVDIIDLCAPTALHPELTIQALKGGKSVVVEKPIALKLTDADAMLEAAEASTGRLFVGHVLPYFPEFAFAYDAIRSERYGKVRVMQLRRVIAGSDEPPAPDAPDDGGPAIDLHVHDTHFIVATCGNPRTVRARGITTPDGRVRHLDAQYVFDEAEPCVTAHCGAMSSPARPFLHGYQIVLDEAILAFEFVNAANGASVPQPVTVYHKDGRVEVPELKSGDPTDAFVSELGEVTAALTDSRPSPLLDGKTARQALALCEAEVESVTSGRAVEIT